MRINPARGCVIPNKKARQKEIAVLTKAQQRDYILATEKEPYRLLFLTALFTGLRQGELAALRWQNLNLNLGIIYVCENLRRYIAYNPDGSSESIKTVQAILGHADIQTTMNIYAHVLNETKKASADKQNALFTELMG